MRKIRVIRFKSMSETQKKLTKRTIAGLTVAAVSVFFSYNLYSNWQALRNYNWIFNYSYLLLASAAMFLTFMSNIVGWGLIVKRLGGPSSFLKNTEIYCLAAHSKRLPGLVWYVAGRAYLYEREAIPISVVVQSSVWEMVLLLLSGLVVYGGFLPFYRKSQYVSFNYLLIVIIPLLLLTVFPALFQRVLRYLKPKESGIQIVRVGWRDKLLWFSVYVLGWIAGGAILYFLAGSVSEVSLSLLPACWGFVALSGVLSTLSFFLPSGLGVREVSLSLLLSSYIPLPVAIALSVLFRIWILIWETALLFLLWGVIKSRVWEKLSLKKVNF